jgi:hypothetical protein
MIQLAEAVEAQQGNVAMHDIPRRTINCIKQFGMKKFPCDFYVPCSHDAHPLTFPELFVERREKDARHSREQAVGV